MSDDYGYTNNDSEWWKKDRDEQPRISSEAVTDLIEEDFQKAYFYIATKMMWDFVFSAIAPNEKELRGVIDSIVQAGSDQVTAQYSDTFANQTSTGMDSQTRGMMYLAKRRAEHNFLKLFKEPIVQPTMLSWMRGKFKKGVKQ